MNVGGSSLCTSDNYSNFVPGRFTWYYSILLSLLRSGLYAVLTILRMRFVGDALQLLLLLLLLRLRLLLLPVLLLLPLYCYGYCQCCCYYCVCSVHRSEVSGCIYGLVCIVPTFISEPFRAWREPAEGASHHGDDVPLLH